MFEYYNTLPESLMKIDQIRFDFYLTNNSIYPSIKKLDKIFFKNVCL